MRQILICMMLAVLSALPVLAAEPPPAKAQEEASSRALGEPKCNAAHGRNPSVDGSSTKVDSLAIQRSELRFRHTS